MLLNNTVRLFLLFVIFSGCTAPKTRNATEQHLMAINGRDTIAIELLLYTETFYGKYELNGPGDHFIVGEIEGEIQSDTLLGSLLYRPHGWSNKKRRAFALKYKDGVYIQGKGQEMIYMNIPYFVPHTLEFTDQSNVFQVKEAPVRAH
ncbi:MAG: hypothetical protein ACTHYC_13010 [Sphingobacterium sp.]